MSDSRRPFGHIYQRRGRVWWIRYTVNGTRYRESSHSTDHKAAERLLHIREAEHGHGVLVTPNVKRTTFEDLATIITDEYRVNGRRSAKRLQQSLANLRAVFGNARASSLTSDRLTAYVRERLDAGAARSTIRNELNALRKAMKLARKAGKVASVPDFPTLTLNNTRTGFFEPEDLAAVLDELPGALRPVIRFAALTGWRIPSEVLTLTWAQVDFTAGVIRLEAGTTKNTEARTLPFRALPELVALLDQQRRETTAVEKRLGCIVRYVFHRDGHAIRPFNDTWNRACRRAAVRVVHGREVVERPQLLDRIPHDLRRTAVRNFERAGVSRSVAMKITGHKTEDVYRRYAIVSEADIADGLGKLAGLGTRAGTIGAPSADAQQENES